MPRQSRRSAPARRPPTQQQTRQAHTMPNRQPPPSQHHQQQAAHPPTAPHQAPPPPVQQGGGGPGLFGQMASTAAGVAVGSAVGHTLANGVSGMFGWVVLYCEKQYNHFYFIPVVSKSFQQKYVRAQDKNAAAEQEVVQIRESIEAIQAAVRQAGNLLGRKQQEHDAQMEQRHAVHVQVAAADKCLAYLHEGQHFWNHFDQNQAEVVIEACSQLMQTFRSTSEPQLFRRRSSSTSADPQQRDWKVIFKSACIEYGEKEAHGASKWDNVEVEFDCARCQQSLVGWPTPDKVHTADLLCAVCYQDMRTSMIMEKKMNVIGGKLGIERPEGPRRYSSSSKSTSRFSTSSVGSSSPSTTPPSSNRSSSFVGDAKKVFKGLSFLSKNPSTSKSTPSTPPISSTVMPSKPHEYDSQPQQRRLPPSERPLPPQPPNAFHNNRPVIA